MSTETKNVSMDVDYVIVYKLDDSDKPGSITQYKQLISKLSSVGLQTEVRNGEGKSLLVFVKPETPQHLYAEVYRSRVRDWLHGVRASAPDKEAQDTEKSHELYPAERLRIVYQLITNPAQEGGAGITPQHGEWTNVDSIFTLHDHEHNRAWLKKWATSSSLKPEDLDEIRNRFGEKIAFYFAFTQAYFTALIAIAGFGVSAWVLLGNFSPIYAVVNGLLCVGFVEYWRFQEDNLAIRWGVRNVSSLETPRHGFTPEKEVTDPVTGEVTQVFSAQKRFVRQLTQIPFMLIAIAVLGSLIATCFAIEIFVSEVYDGPLKSVLVFLPTGILTTIQPLLLGVLTSLATTLTKYENYDTDSAHDKALTQKIFILNFITSYMPILLTAFVYMPFAKVIVPYLDVFSLTVKPFAENSKQMDTPPPGSFRINPDRLKKQVIYFAVTAQIVNQALEIGLPYIQKKGTDKYKEMQAKKNGGKGGSSDDVSANDPTEEKEFLTRVREEAERETYDVTGDFREMVVQYGYLVLFGVVWPPTAVSFLINNWFELRTDAAKICSQSRRPTPWRADSIGPWLDSLGFLTWFGSVTQAAIVYLFSGRESEGPAGSPEAILGWVLLLYILTSEHVYFLVRWGARSLVSRLDSPGRQMERAERYSTRKKYLDENIGEQAAKVAPKLMQQDISRRTLEDDAREQSIGHSGIERRFWARQKGWQETAKFGELLMERAASQETRKSK